MTKLTNTKFYVDDGYTGTNFNRPGFQAMLEDIEMGYVTTVMVIENPVKEENVVLEARQGVAVEYLTA